MVDRGTEGVRSARIHAWVAAFLIETCSILRAVIVDDALGVRTDCDSIVDTTKSVGSTRRRIAWVDRFGLTTGHKRITDHLRWTRAYRTMVERMTLGTVATLSWTRIDALVVYARPVTLTVRIDCTFGLASRAGWCSEIPWNALTNGQVVRCSANGICATW